MFKKDELLKNSSRVRLALKPRFLSKGLASQSVRICVFVAYRVSGHSTQDNWIVSIPCSCFKRIWSDTLDKFPWTRFKRDIIVLAARRLECFDSTAWNRYYSIVLSRVSRHSICNEHTHPNGLTGQTLGWETSVSKLTSLSQTTVKWCEISQLQPHEEVDFRR